MQLLGGQLDESSYDVVQLIKHIIIYPINLKMLATFTVRGELVEP